MMNSSDYIKNAIKTESVDFEAIENRLSQKGMFRLLHAGMGLSTESGEFLDSLKKHIFYGKPLDKINLAEELGDLFWYCAIVADELGVEFEPIMERNIEKLKARYGDRFNEEKAENRDLKRERDILEKQKLQ
jgi:NTP pyrophosphatase (non-canonical NTP hydrolase)